LNRADGTAVLANLAAAAKSLGVIKDGWNGFNILHTEASQVGALDIGFVPGEGGKDTGGMLESGALDVLFLLGVDEIEVPEGAFVVYQGTHGDRGAHRADVILPGAAYTEKSAIYVNTEGRVQMADRAGFPPGEAREDWAILRALSAVLGQALEFDSLPQLRSKVFEAVPHMAAIDSIEAGDAADIAEAGQWQSQDGQRRVCKRNPGLLFDQPDRTRLQGDGRVFGAREDACRRSCGIRGRGPKWLSS
jgi:NADH-quinone oxidoreductase subunit G